VLSCPPRASHILQMYDSEDFLAAAVAHFAAEGLKNGESVLLTGTREHLADIDRELSLVGVDAEAAASSGQLSRTDVHAALAMVVPNGKLDRERFRVLADEPFEQAQADPRFTGVRWWGEVTNTLHHRGERAAGLLAERLGDAAAKKYGATLFCSFRCDRFDARGYDDVLTDLCCLHSHVIPAEDYALHRLAVNRAVEDVVGEIEGVLLQSLASWKGLACDLPSSQALLFWLRETMPERFEAVLERARAYQTDEESA
jgi:hypothetical protein